MQKTPATTDHPIALHLGFVCCVNHCKSLKPCRAEDVNQKPNDLELTYHDSHYLSSESTSHNVLPKNPNVTDIVELYAFQSLQL